MKKKDMLFGVAVLFGMVALAMWFLTIQVTPVIAQSGKGEICDNKVDDDGDKLVDCEDSDCSKFCDGGEAGCSPGYYKNHPEIWVGTCCEGAECDAIMSALTCRGSDASCGRSDAAAFLDACTGCTED